MFFFSFVFLSFLFSQQQYHCKGVAKPMSPMERLQQIKEGGLLLPASMSIVVEQQIADVKMNLRSQCTKENCRRVGYGKVLVD
jgi:hypothetical protein